MLFVSLQFVLLFLPVTVAGFFLLSFRYPETSLAFLAVMSVAFLALSGGNPLLLLVSVVANYVFGALIASASGGTKTKQARRLVAALIFNLGALIYYKYANWFIESLSLVLGRHLASLDVVLPIGISFFTFTQIAFLVDCYSGKAREPKFAHYLLFVSFFPHLIAGPILHHSEMMPQFSDKSNKRLLPRNCLLGLLQFLIGAVKKVVLADGVSVFVAPVFDAHGAAPAAVDAWSAALAYALQIYFDFSGYTDMALGISLIFNVKLPLNFNSPYKATSVIDFWRRWHMTLSRFLRDYLYFALGGNRHGKVRRYGNLMATMLLGGLWNGSGWNFVVWGGLHGTYLMINHAVRASALAAVLASKWWFVLLGRIATLVAVLVAWVFFRADDLDSALRVLAGMINVGERPVSYLQDVQPGLLPFVATSPWAWIAALFAIAWVMPNSQETIAGVDRFAHRYRGWMKLSTWQTASLSFVALLLVFVVALSVVRDAESPFIYFNF